MLRYRQLIADLRFTQQLWFGSESHDETKIECKNFSVLIAEILLSNIYIQKSNPQAKGAKFYSDRSIPMVKM